MFFIASKWSVAAVLNVFYLVILLKLSCTTVKNLMYAMLLDCTVNNCKTSFHGRISFLRQIFVRYSVQCFNRPAQNLPVMSESDGIWGALLTSCADKDINVTLNKWCRQSHHGVFTSVAQFLTNVIQFQSFPEELKARIYKSDFSKQWK